MGLVAVILGLALGVATAHAQDWATCKVAVKGVGPIRNVTMNNACPVYFNGCSGPSDAGPFTPGLTPCCQQHDICYSCGWKLSPAVTKRGCDDLFNACLQAVCRVAYPGSETACRAQVLIMYGAVRAAPDSFYQNDACPGNIASLANVSYGIVPTYEGTYQATARPNNGGPYGVWGDFAECPFGSWMVGIQIRAQPDQGVLGLDSAATALRIRCANPAGKITATDLGLGNNGEKGNWYGYYSCPKGTWVVGMSQKVEAGPSADLTGLNRIRLRCSDGTQVEAPVGPDVTNYGEWSTTDAVCPPSTAVCAVKARIENAMAADETGMNGVEVGCCTVCADGQYAHQGKCVTACPAMRWGAECRNVGEKAVKCENDVPSGTVVYGGACVTPTVSCTGTTASGNLECTETTTGKVRKYSVSAVNVSMFVESWGPSMPWYGNQDVAKVWLKAVGDKAGYPQRGTSPYALFLRGDRNLAAMGAAPGGVVSGQLVGLNPETPINADNLAFSTAWYLKAVETCPMGRFLGESGCAACADSCNKCTSGSPSACTTCAAPKYLSSGSCVTSCPSGTTASGGVCIARS